MRKAAMNKVAIIYCAVCEHNGKKYIGVTTRSLAKRRSDHKLHAAQKRNKGYFHKAIRKYGIESFVFFTLEHCESMTLALRREIEIIAATRPEYNNTLGGEGQLGRTHTPEYRKVLSERSKGNAWAKGHKMPLKLKARLLVINTGAKRPNSIPPDNSKKIICIEDGKVFASGAEAARFYKCHPSQILQVCKKYRYHKTAAGKTFKFLANDVKEAA
jgi:group I intron endonuclease